MRSLFVLVPPLFLIFLVLGTIFLGIATPTEGGAMGASGALLLALSKKKLNMTLIRQALSDAGVPMRFVTGPQLSNDTRIIGCSDLVESYEVQKGLLSAQNITHLGLDIAYRGYVSFYGRREGFVKLT